MALKFNTNINANTDDFLNNLGLLGEQKTTITTPTKTQEKTSFLGKVGQGLQGIESGVSGFIKETGTAIGEGASKLGSDIQKIQSGTLGQDTGAETGLLGRTVEKFGEAQEGIKQAKISEVAGKQSGTRSLLQSMGLLGLSASDTIGDAVITGLKTIAPEKLETTIKEGIQTAVNTKGGQAVMSEVNKALEGYKNLQQTDPEKARDYKAFFGALQLAGDVVGFGTLAKGSKLGQKVITEGAEVIGDGITKGKTGIKGSANKVLENLQKTKTKVINKTDTVGKSLEEQGYNLRNTLSGLNEREVSALKNTPKKEWEEILTQAKTAKGNDYAQTPYNIGANKANEAFKKVETNLDTSQKARISELKESPIKQIETAEVRKNIVDDIKETFNVEGIKVGKDGKITYNPTKGRKVLLDESNPRDLETLKLLEEATRADTPLKMMDTVKQMQNIIYDSNILNKASKNMSNLVKRSIGKLNSTFKKQVGEKYSNILDDMAKDISMKSELDRVFKAGADEIQNRGELAMKRLASGTTTSAEARNLALKIKEKYGIDLIKEARLRQLAMDIVGDDRGGTLFKKIKEGKAGLLEKGYETLIDKTPLSKEKTALSRVGKNLQSKTTKNADTTNNIVINTPNKKTTGNNISKDIVANSKSNDMGVKTPTKKLEAKIKTPTKTTKSIKTPTTTKTIETNPKTVTVYQGRKGKGSNKKFPLDYYAETENIAKSYGTNVTKKTIKLENLADFTKNNDKLKKILEDNFGYIKDNITGEYTKKIKPEEVKRLVDKALKEKSDTLPGGTPLYEIIEDKFVVKALKKAGFDGVKYKDFGGKNLNYKSHNTIALLK